MKKRFLPEQAVRIFNKARIGAKNSGMSIGDVRINRVLKNKNQVVRQGTRRCDKRSIFSGHM